MEQSILKANWERHVEHGAINVSLAQSLLAEYTTSQVANIQVLNNGCANANYKVSFSGNEEPVVLRIYQRDHNAINKEVAIHKLVGAAIPCPNYLYTNDTCKLILHPYAVTQFIEGILLRDLVFSHDEEAISQCLYEAGEYIHMLKQMVLPYGGFFQDDMQIKPFNDDESYDVFIFQLMQDPTVQASLGTKTINELQQLLSQTTHLLPTANDANLTHGDFDPSNIIVINDQGKWKINGILDWEFCFAGSYLFDMGMMLRYSHKLPDYYESSFIKGITDAGTTLPNDWKKQTKLVDLLNLFQLIHASPAQEKPFRNQDLIRLIRHTVQKFRSF